MLCLSWLFGQASVDDVGFSSCLLGRESLIFLEAIWMRERQTLKLVYEKCVVREVRR